MDITSVAVVTTITVTIVAIAITIAIAMSSRAILFYVTIIARRGTRG